MTRLFRTAAPVALLLALASAASAEVAAPKVERAGPAALVVTWTDADPVDVYESDAPDVPLAGAKLVSEANRTGRFEVGAAPADRLYFLLKDRGDGKVVRVAERALPLEQGSNFRDLGGYPAADGKHVKWGRIFRSGGTPLLSEGDLAQIKALGLTEMVDLRSSEERVLAPSRIEGVRYQAVGYSMLKIMGPGQAPTGMGDERMHQVYRNFPTLLAPQLKVLFQGLLEGDGALEFNCSAGQDRTGFASAMILSALGVPREVILQDYHLSTTYRRPQYEMPRFDEATIAANPVAKIFAGYQQDPRARTPQPLFDSQQKPLLAFALEEVEAKWGSVDAYLAKEAGMGPAEIAKLRAMYLE
jgi:protein-tyrosine phosphatase